MDQSPEISPMQFKSLPGSPFPLTRRTYTMSGTPEDIVHCVESQIQQLETPTQYEYYDSHLRVALFPTSELERIDLWVNFYTNKDGKNLVEFQRIHGSQHLYYPLLYKILAGLELEDPIVFPAIPEELAEMCGLLRLPVTEAIQLLTRMSSPYEETRIHSLYTFRCTINQFPGIIDNLLEYSPLECVLRTVAGSTNTELYRHAALTIQCITKACPELAQVAIQYMSCFDELTFGDVLAKREIKRIVCEIYGA